MTPIKCIAIDDEELALELLIDNIRQIPFLELVGTSTNAFEAIELMANKEVDLIFLDIQMPGLSGIQFLKSLTTNPLVILITAYEEFALQGFDLNVVDYLLKPVPFERFMKSCVKAAELYNLRKNSSTSANQEYIFVNSEYSLVKVVFNEIMYIEGLKDYIKIYVEDQKHPLITRMTMKHMEELLQSKRFMRVHKSFIVPIDKINSIRNLKINIKEVQIPVSEQNIEQLLEKISGR
jgi:two-component system, LytTR family, response regulator